ncbi:MAG TPA: DUF3592 domain-containing protein [Chthonomonadaceae bacterium]|nr:DUF3592 domain-containing protein [Chthonomonadaceae bacterium]
MRRFRPRLLVMAAVCATGAGFLWLAWFLLDGMRTAPPAGDPWMWGPPTVGLAAIAAIFGLAFVCAPMAGAALIEVDEEGITLRTLAGARRIFWRNLARCELRGTEHDDVGLWDAEGRRLRIETGWFVDGRELLAILQERIAPLQQQTLREWRQHGVAIRGRLPVGWWMLAVYGVLAAISFFGAWAMFRVPAHDGFQRAALIAAAPLFAALGTGLCWLIVDSATRVLRLTQKGLSMHSAVFRIEVDYDAIVAIWRYGVTVQSTSVKHLYLRTRDGRRTGISSSYPNFELIAALVLERAPESARTTGDSERARIARSQRRQVEAINRVLVPLAVVCMIAMPIYFYREGQTETDRYRRFMRQTVPGTAIVVAKTSTGGRRPECALRYRFQPAGTTRRVQADESVPPDVWTHARVGEPLTVLYLPREPLKCRLAASMDAQAGERSKRSAVVMFVLCAAFSGLLILQGRKARRRNTVGKA